MVQVRTIDELGRFIIPSEWRKKCLKNNQVEIIIEKGRLTLRSFNWEDVKKREYIGIVRQLDNLGRICIPKEMRQTLKLPSKIRVSLEIEADKIRLIPENEMKNLA